MTSSCFRTRFVEVSEKYLPHPGGSPGMLPRKRFKDLQLDATVFEQPAYLRPPNDTPQPSGDSDQSPPEIIKWLKDSPSLSAVRNQLEVPKSPHHEAQKTLSQDCKPETQVC